MTIQHISFIHPVSIGGDLHSIGSYNRLTHGDHLELIEKGNFLVIKLRKQPGHQRRVPITNISFIAETEDEQPTVKK